MVFYTLSMHVQGRMHLNYAAVFSPLLEAVALSCCATDCVPVAACGQALKFSYVVQGGNYLAFTRSRHISWHCSVNRQGILIIPMRHES